MRTPKQQVGDSGETEIVENAPCPNCGKRLTELPRNYPLYDVQCEGCSFRAQVKTSNSASKSTVRGAGWDIIHKVLKAGFMSPPLIVNFNPPGREPEILFFPFVPRSCLTKYRLSKHHRQPRYAMFDYRGLDKLPHFRLAKQGKKIYWMANA
ncbi:MAG TPA: DpnI domain-containing protein [Sedimentisphaerales bacterium]